VIRVNDHLDVEWSEGMAVDDVLQGCGFTYPLVVVSVNGQVVPKAAYRTHAVQDGDRVRVLHLVAGG
jgi:sulfur carrier protein